MKRVNIFSRGSLSSPGRVGLLPISNFYLGNKPQLAFQKRTPNLHKFNPKKQQHIKCSDDK